MKIPTGRKLTNIRAAFQIWCISTIKCSMCIARVKFVILKVPVHCKSTNSSQRQPWTPEAAPHLIVIYKVWRLHVTPPFASTRLPLQPLSIDPSIHRAVQPPSHNTKEEGQNDHPSIWRPTYRPQTPGSRLLLSLLLFKHHPLLRIQLQSTVDQMVWSITSQQCPMRMRRRRQRQLRPPPPPPHSMRLHPRSMELSSALRIMPSYHPSPVSPTRSYQQGKTHR